MIKKITIGMLIGICFLLSACSEQEEYENLLNNGIGEKEKVEVRLSLSPLPEIQMEGSTDYRPMAAREAGSVRSIICDVYKCLVMKEIDDKWYVDTLMEQTLTGQPVTNDNRRATIKVEENMKFEDIRLTLRPGHYRVLAVLNPVSTKWNSQLVPGALVKGKEEADTVAHAYTYFFQESYTYGNHGKREVRYEVFSGTADFTVEKTSDVHSDPINGNTRITFARRVMQIHFLLKDHEITGNDYNFSNTQYTIYATLKATGEEAYFCDGLDCFGKAYYTREKHTTEMDICTQVIGYWRMAENGMRYKMAAYNVTVHSPFVFADDTASVPYQIEKVKIIGQADGYRYEYPGIITDLILKNDTIQQVVFQVTDKATDDEPRCVTLDYLKEESNLRLFDPYYECNIP